MLFTVSLPNAIIIHFFFFYSFLLFGGIDFHRTSRWCFFFCVSNGGIVRLLVQGRSTLPFGDRLEQGLLPALGPGANTDQHLEDLEISEGFRAKIKANFEQNNIENYTITFIKTLILWRQRSAAEYL
jgi:hypothetical protein